MPSCYCMFHRTLFLYIYVMFIKPVHTMTNLIGLLYLLPHILILVAVIQLLSKFSEPESYLLLIGAITSILTSLFYTFGIQFVHDQGVEFYEITTIVSAVAGIGHLCFAIGLFLLVQRVLKTKA